MGFLDMNDPEAMSQLALSMGLLTAKQGQPWPALIAQYAQSVQQRREQALRDQLLQQQLQGGGIDLKTKQQQYEDMQKARDVLRSNMGPEPQAPVQAPGGGMMTAPQAPSAPGAAVSGVVPGKNQTFTFYKAIGDKMAAQGLPEQAQKYYDLAEKYRPKLKDTKTLTDPNTQQRVTVNFYEDGTHEVVPLAPDQEKAHFADTGGQIVPLDPITGKPRGQGMAKTVSPDTRFTGGVAMRGQDLNDARERQNIGIRQAELAYNTGLGAGNYNFPSPTVPGADLSGLSPKERSGVAGDVAKKGGEATQQARMDLPNVEAQTQQTIKLVDELVKHPGFSGTVGAKSPLGALAAAGYPVPGTDTADFAARRKQVVGQQFMQAFQTLKGGGQITEVEGEKATNAISRMNTSQSEQEFINAANDFKQVLQAGLMRARAKAGGTTGFRVIGRE